MEQVGKPCACASAPTAGVIVPDSTHNPASVRSVLNVLMSLPSRKARCRLRYYPGAASSSESRRGGGPAGRCGAALCCRNRVLFCHCIAQTLQQRPRPELANILLGYERMSLDAPANASPLVQRLSQIFERWSPFVPAQLRREFNSELAAVGHEHDRTLDTIERIFCRLDRRLALDESTCLARRRPFLEHLAAVLALDAPAFRAVAVLFLDVDNLKALNDRFGHDAGDRALAAVGRIIRDAIRAERDVDFAERAIPDDDYSISRHGGDEFLVVLELDDPSGIDVAAPRIKRRLDDAERQRASGHIAPVKVTVSMGGVVYELPHTRPPLAATALARNLIAAADEQMYEGKRDGLVHIAMARFTDRLEVDRLNARKLSVNLSSARPCAS